MIRVWVKPEMRPNTATEIADCNQCGPLGQHPTGKFPQPGDTCWFTCETPITPTPDPMWEAVPAREDQK